MRSLCLAKIVVMENGYWFSSVTRYFCEPKRPTPDPPDQKEKNILPVPENSTVTDLRVRPLFQSYLRYESLFWPGFSV